jgi:hypothetical protein
LLPPPEKASVKLFKVYEPGFLHVDVKYLPATESEPCRYLLSPSTGRPLGLYRPQGEPHRTVRQGIP